MFFARAASFRSSAPRRSAGAILKNRGYGRSGNESGPLRDLPDWEFADGTPAPISKGRKRSENQKKRTEEKIAAARAAFPSDPEQLRIAILEGKKGIYKREFEKKALEEKAARKAATSQRKKEQKAITKSDSTEAKPKTTRTATQAKAQKSAKPADDRKTDS